MLTIVQRSSASKEKPTDIVRGVSSRLPWAWDGLCFGVAMQDANNDGIRDIVNNIAPSVVSESFWSRDNRGNPVLRFQMPGSTPYAEWPEVAVHNAPSTALTAYIRMQRLGNADQDGGAFSKPYGFSDPWETWSINATDSAVDGSTLYGIVGIGGTQYLTGDTVTIPSTQQVSVFLRWRSGLAPQIDVLGERGDSITSLTGPTAATGSLQYASGFSGIRINSHESTTSNYYGYYTQAMVWKRRLGDVEMTSLVADPFGWYSPRRETIGLSSPYPLIAGASEMRFGTGSGGLR